MPFVKSVNKDKDKSLNDYWHFFEIQYNGGRLNSLSLL
jgi:hypothetical protein